MSEGPWKVEQGQVRRLYTEYFVRGEDKSEFGPMSYEGAHNQCAMLNAAESKRAAAEEMFEALEAIVNDMGEWDLPIWLFEQATAALNKARGTA